jgi:hypothetical protein
MKKWRPTSGKILTMEDIEDLINLGISVLFENIKWYPLVFGVSLNSNYFLKKNRKSYVQYSDKVPSGQWNDAAHSQDQ